MVQATPSGKNTGWDLNDNKLVNLPSQDSIGQPSAISGGPAASQPR